MELPYITAGLPGVGGTLKASPADFAVEEVPLYAPCGQGPHLYLTLRRQGLATREVCDMLARAYGVAAADVGYAGLKDKDAVTTQTFSLPAALSADEARARSAGAPWELLAVSRHGNKLKPGHLLGNRFAITLRAPSGGLAEAQAVAASLRATGLPNYFGAQRFGRQGDNAAEGLKLLRRGRKGRGWKEKFLLSAAQSYAYNAYLAERLRRGLFQTVLTGDVCKKYATGGLFVSADGAAETGRFLAGEITHAGPVFGAKTKPAEAGAAALEQDVLASLGLAEGDMALAGAGDRRPNRVLLPDLTVEPAGADLRFTFTLPKGAYATTVMREFMKP